MACLFLRLQGHRGQQGEHGDGGHGRGRMTHRSTSGEGSDSAASNVRAPAEERNAHGPRGHFGPACARAVHRSCRPLSSNPDGFTLFTFFTNSLPALDDTTGPAAVHMDVGPPRSRCAPWAGPPCLRTWVCFRIRPLRPRAAIPLATRRGRARLRPACPSRWRPAPCAASSP